MGKGRLEAFSDGFFAVIITIMVLEMKTPLGEGLAAFYDPRISDGLYILVALIWLVPDRRIEHAIGSRRA